MEPRVSFVVPCYNYGRFVAQAVDSLLTQSFERIEVIVIDDHSPDETPQVLARYDTEPRVRVIRHEQNRGHIYSYNEGLALARGEYLGLLSADDWCLSPEAVARQVDIFDGQPNVGMVYAAYALVEQGRVTHKVIPWPQDYVRNGLDEFRHLMWSNHVPHSGTLIRREVQHQIGMYDPRLPHCGDWDLWLRAATKSDVGYIAAPLYGYRMHEVNMSHKRWSPAQTIDETTLMLDRAFASLPPQVPADILAARDAVFAHGLLQNAWIDLFHGRRARTWRGVAYAVKRRPALLVDREFRGFIPRLLMMTALGRERSQRMMGRLERLRGRRQPAAQPA